MAKTKSNVTLKPNLGLFLSVSPLVVPAGGLSDGYNFRIQDGDLSNLNLGWDQLGSFTLNGPVVWQDFFFVGGTDERDILVTPTDMYSLNTTDNTVKFITPAYVTGTAAASGTAVTGSGTAWNTNDTWGVKNAKAGDYINFTSASQQSTSAVWYKIASVTNDTTLTLTASAGTIVAHAYTLRRCFTGDVQNKWRSDFFPVPAGTSLWFATNGLDPIVKWDGITTFATFSTITSKAQTLRVFDNMLILGAPTVGGVYYPTSILNSDPGSPENVSTGLATQLVTYAGTNPVQLLEPIGDNLTVYSRRNIALMQFVGGDTVWNIRQVVQDLGPIAGGLIADLGDFHEFIGEDAQYTFDGVSIKETGHQVWREVVRTRDSTRQANGFIHFNEEHGDLMWVVPLVTDPDQDNTDAPAATAFVEHYLEDVGDKNECPVSRRSCPFLSAGYSERAGTLQWDSTDAGPLWSDMQFRWNDQAVFQAFPISIMGDSAGKVWQINISQQANSVALPSFVTFPRRAIYDGRMRGLVSRIYPFVLPFANDLDITCRFYDSALGSAQAEETFSWDQVQAEGGHFQTIYRRGRFWEVDFGSDAGEPWQLTGWDYDVKPGGTR